MTVMDVRPTAAGEKEPTAESARVAELREMIRSGRYAGYLDELRDELAKAKAARGEIRALTARAALGA